MIPRLVAQKKDLVFHEESVGTVICEIRPIFVRGDHFLFVCDVALWNFLVESFGNFQDLVAVIEIAYMLQVIPKVLLVLRDWELLADPIHMFRPFWGESLGFILLLFLSRHLQNTHEIANIHWTKTNHLWNLSAIFVDFVDLLPLSRCKGK